MPFGAIAGGVIGAGVSSAVGGGLLGAAAGGLSSSLVGGAINGAMGGGSAGGGGGGAGGFTGPNTGMANDLWGIGANNLNDIAGAAFDNSIDPYLKSYRKLNSIDYTALRKAAAAAGNEYTTAGQVGRSSVAPLVGAAGAAGLQQQPLYNAGAQVLNSAFDPQLALYNQSVNNLSNQVNTGQAMRGLGNSAVGGQEYNDAMANFNTQWQAQQLARQAQGINAAAQANSAGGQQAQLMANLYGNAVTQGSGSAQNLLTGGQIPLQTTQYVANQPAANASALGQNLSNAASLQANLMSQSLPYITGGQGATQFNTGYQTQQNQSLASLGTQLANGITQNGGIGSTLSNIFGGGNNIFGTSNSAPAYYDVPQANLASSNPGSYSGSGLFGGGGGGGDVGSGFNFNFGF